MVFEYFRIESTREIVSKILGKLEIMILLSGNFLSLYENTMIF